MHNPRALSGFHAGCALLWFWYYQTLEHVVSVDLVADRPLDIGMVVASESSSTTGSLRRAPPNNNGGTKKMNATTALLGRYGVLSTIALAMVLLNTGAAAGLWRRRCYGEIFAGLSYLINIYWLISQWLLFVSSKEDRLRQSDEAPEVVASALTVVSVVAAVGACCLLLVPSGGSQRRRCSTATNNNPTFEEKRTAIIRKELLKQKVTRALTEAVRLSGARQRNSWEYLRD